MKLGVRSKHLNHAAGQMTLPLNASSSQEKDTIMCYMCPISFSQHIEP
jgi:hypothetical protein